MGEKIRYTRKDLKGPDEFISTFGRVLEWCRENRSVVAKGLLAVTAVLVLTLAASGYIQWKERRAAAGIWPYLEQAREMMAAPSGEASGDIAAMEKTISSLAEKHSGTRAALYAQYYLGSIAFRRGDYEGSAARFREAIGNGKDEGVLRYLLRKGVACSLEGKGDFAAAAAAYRDAAEYAGPQMKVQALLDEARALGLSGKKAEAVSVYRQIVKENPDSVKKDLIEIKMAHME
jgi:tetratricopeptide (TPR) repeat protein